MGKNARMSEHLFAAELLQQRQQPAGVVEMSMGEHDFVHFGQIFPHPSPIVQQGGPLAGIEQQWLPRRRFDQGAEADRFFLLLHGHVRAAKTTPTGEQIVVRYVSPGETFGLAMAIGLTQYPATATAVDDSVVLAWPTGTWPRLVEKFPALATNTLQAVGARLQETHTRVLEMSTQQVEQRVAHALLRLANQSGKKLDHGIEIDFPISRQDIAEMTGTTLHTVSRTLSQWEAKGILKTGREQVIILYPHGLVEIAEDLPPKAER